MKSVKRRAKRADRARAAQRRPKRTATASGRAASSKPRRDRASSRTAAADKRAIEIFEQQIQPAWTRFGQECQQFAEGFNAEMRSHQLHVECGPNTIQAKFAQGGEVFVQLDLENRQIACWITSCCGTFGSGIVEQSPIGLTNDVDRLRFVYGGPMVTEDDLAVSLLTYLTQCDTPAARA